MSKFVINDEGNQVELKFDPDGADEGYVAVYIMPIEEGGECAIVSLEELRRAIEWLIGPHDCN